MIDFKLAKNSISFEIKKLATEVNENIKQGDKIYNLAIADLKS
jgi:hypothetical protein